MGLSVGVGGLPVGLLFEFWTEDRDINCFTKAGPSHNMYVLRGK